MNAEMVRAMNKPAMKQRLAQDGLVADPMSVEQLKALIQSEQQRYRPALERAGLVGKQ
jgi:tripartite-type tricarboxylate transporter receptor subunit TctC